MPEREMRNPEWAIEDHEDGLLLRFMVPGSKFGTVAVTLSLLEAVALSDSLAMAEAFAAVSPKEDE